MVWLLDNNAIQWRSWVLNLMSTWILETQVKINFSDTLNIKRFYAFIY